MNFINKNIYIKKGYKGLYIGISNNMKNNKILNFLL